MNFTQITQVVSDHPVSTAAVITGAIAIATLVVLVLVRSIRHHRALKAAHAAVLPDGTVEITTETHTSLSLTITHGTSASATSAPALATHHDTSGRIMLVLCGTFAEHLGDDLLSLLHRCGLHEAIGSVLLIELDSRRRNRFLASVPAVYHDRLETVSFSGLSGGLGNEEPDVVLRHIDSWGPPVVRGAQAVCRLHRRVNRGGEPALVLSFISQGGQAMIGPEALKHISRQFRLAKHYGFTALPVDDLLRVRTPRVLDAYRAQGVKGFVVSDNLTDSVINDFGMMASIVGFIAASENADSPTEQNNAWHRLFAEAPGHVVTFGTHANHIPGFVFQPHPDLRPRYFVYRDSVQSVIRAGLDEVTRPEASALHGIGQGEHVPMTSRFDIVLAAIVPHHLKEDEDDILLGLELKAVDRRNRHHIFAPISTVIDAHDPLCPVAVVSLYAVPDGHAVITALTNAGGHATHLLPVGPAESIVIDGTVHHSTNGHSNSHTNGHVNGAVPAEPVHAAHADEDHEEVSDARAH